jgi:hypothetical protein
MCLQCYDSVCTGVDLGFCDFYIMLAKLTVVYLPTIYANSVLQRTQ